MREMTSCSRSHFFVVLFILPCIALAQDKKTYAQARCTSQDDCAQDSGAICADMPFVDPDTKNLYCVCEASTGRTGARCEVPIKERYAALWLSLLLVEIPFKIYLLGIFSKIYQNAKLNIGEKLFRNSELRWLMISLALKNVLHITLYILDFIYYPESGLSASRGGRRVFDGLQQLLTHSISFLFLYSFTKSMKLGKMKGSKAKVKRSLKRTKTMFSGLGGLYFCFCVVRDFVPNQYQLLMQGVDVFLALCYAITVLYYQCKYVYQAINVLSSTTGGNGLNDKSKSAVRRLSRTTSVVIFGHAFAMLVWIPILIVLVSTQSHVAAFLWFKFFPVTEVIYGFAYAYAFGQHLDNSKELREKAKMDTAVSDNASSIQISNDAGDENTDSDL